MITCNKNVANAVGGKTARACDSCIKKRARWYCASDDAFLCQSCDSSVHSANSLALRHERVRLKTASFNSFDIEPSWHRGLTRKPRTPRPAKILSDNNKSKHPIHSIPFVPELVASNEDIEQEQQLLYRVPIFDPFAAELCSSTTNVSNEAETAVNTPANGVESRECFGGSSSGGRLHGFVTSDMDLSDFAEDVESLLGRGLENECFRMEELGLVDCKEEKEELHCLKRGKVKLEEEEKNEQQQQQRELDVDTEIDMAKASPFELSFEYDSATCGEEEEKVEPKFKNNNINGEYENESEKKTKKNNKKKRKIVLSLDYDAVISAWANQGCPWTNGNRPEVDLDDECWPDWIMGNWGGEVEQEGYGGGKGGQYAVMGGGGREARVSRYREKRRTRLFTKKIRYEVRKLNAEKRPRMKGRFVKRATFGAAASLH